MDQPILDLKNLSVMYSGVKVVSNVSFTIFKGETFAVVGESGCGKTTIANSILRVLPPDGSIDKNSKILYYRDSSRFFDIVKLNENDMTKYIRWREISMVPQSALNALNPTIKVRDHFIETAKAHGFNDKKEILEKARVMLEAVKLDADRVLNMYPIELSGGMKQRTLIALALFLNPKFVILDEPTTALDVLTQREIIILLKDLKDKMGLTYMLITHDIALVADIADRVAVMYAGRLCELGDIYKIFYNPQHPYTQMLLASVPKLGEFKIPRAVFGVSIDYRRLPLGCKFHSRCPFAMDICRREEPLMVELEKNHFIACWLYMKR
ncbi:MAG: ABC transporter ATP-binding protein [Ignisphaera sp.]